MLPSATVAEKGVVAMLKGKKTRVTGILNKLSCFFASISHRGLASRASYVVLGKPRIALPPRENHEHGS